MIDKGILSIERKRESFVQSRLGVGSDKKQFLYSFLYSFQCCLGRRDWRLGLSGMMIVVRRPLGVVDTSAPPLSSGSALCPSLVVARGRRWNKDGESLRQKRRRWERPVFLRWSCAVSCKPPGKLDTVALALSQGSTRLWRTFDSLYHRHLEKSIEILPSWKKIGKQLVHWGDLLSILSISFLQFFFFFSRKKIPSIWIGKDSS